MTTPRVALDSAEVDRLVSGDHHDPHRILGAHPGGGRTTVRAFHPEASEARLVYAGGEIPLRRIDERGLFEGSVDTEPLSEYRLRFAAGANSWEMDDPYRFLPTLGELDLHLIGEGSHGELWNRLGARVIEHQGVRGTAFAVWAPNARGVHLISDASYWDTRLHPMRALGGTGVWELFLPHAAEGLKYKFSVRRADGRQVFKADPLAKAMELPPGSASIVVDSHHTWGDQGWMGSRHSSDGIGDAMSVYEVHLGSWRRDQGRELTYRESGQLLADYCSEMGFTHVELMPIAEHPFGGSWGYQVSSYYAPTSRFGTPDDFRWMVDHLHQRGIGVILDWVPAHFPKDEWALAQFDGTSLYEHVDPRRGEHPDWGTLVFNYGRNEVRNFLVANARYWCEEFHIDALRVDAVASMLYLDYSRKAGEWLPNLHGGRENLEAIALLREVNDAVSTDYPGAFTVAEESTAWPGVSRPTAWGGLGFRFKWNMGWMHDTLDYLSKDPVFRKYHHHQLTFGLWYAYSENFTLPLSHDEVVHGKGSLLGKMPGDRWQKLANLRAMLAWMWAHPGKKLLFMGAELAQDREWSHDRELDWFLLDNPRHRGVQAMLRDTNARYRATPALWERDGSADGFQWVDAGNVDQNVYSFLRFDAHDHPGIACIANFSPNVYEGFRVGLPRAGRWDEVLNTDATEYGGAGVGNLGAVQAEDRAWNGQPCSAVITVPPLAVLWFTPAGS
ncbi:MAG: 1,4-alpha-glucan branching protein GlgB [Candidatus Dormibacteria bacterium]